MHSPKRLPDITSDMKISVGTSARALAVATGIFFIYKVLTVAKTRFSVFWRAEKNEPFASTESSSPGEIRRLNARVVDLENQLHQSRHVNARVVDLENQLHQIRQPLQSTCGDLMFEILECLYVEELCALLRTSSWFRSHVSQALQRRKVAVPDVRHQKWHKSSSVLPEERRITKLPNARPGDRGKANYNDFYYHTNFDGRDEQAWCSDYATAIARHCKNVETVESGHFAKERFLLKRSDFLYFKEFQKKDTLLLINSCPNIRHIDGIIVLHVADFDDVSTHTLSMRALRLVFDSEWTTRVEGLKSFMAKCVELEYLELEDGSGDGERVSFRHLLDTALADCVRHVRCLKINHFILSEADTDSLTKSFPNLNGLALDTLRATGNFLVRLFSMKTDAVDTLDITLDEVEDLQYLSEISESILAREVVIKVLRPREGIRKASWASEYALRFPCAQKVSLVFVKQSVEVWEDEVCNRCMLAINSHGDDVDFTTIELNNFEQLRLSRCFDVDSYDENALFGIAHAVRDSAPCVEALFVASVDRTSLPKFGLHEQFSPAIERRALDLMRGADIFKTLDEYDCSETSSFGDPERAYLDSD